MRLSIMPHFPYFILGRFLSDLRASASIALNTDLHFFDRLSYQLKLVILLLTAADAFDVPPLNVPPVAKGRSSL